MKEHRLMVKPYDLAAIVERRATQVRIPLNPQPQNYPARIERCEGWPVKGVSFVPTSRSGKIGIFEPRLYRSPWAEGDHLWLAEKWALVPRTAYRASEGVEQVLRPDDDHDAAVYRLGWTLSNPGYWRSSGSMPRWASRVRMQVRSVRTQRLGDMTEEDALAEGAEPIQWGKWWQGYRDLNGALLHQVVPGEQPPDWMIEPHAMDQSHMNRTALEVRKSQMGRSSDTWFWVIGIAYKEHGHRHYEEPDPKGGEPLIAVAWNVTRVLRDGSAAWHIQRDDGKGTLCGRSCTGGDLYDYGLEPFSAIADRCCQRCRASYELHKERGYA